MGQAPWKHHLAFVVTRKEAKRSRLNGEALKQIVKKERQSVWPPILRGWRRPT